MAYSQLEIMFVTISNGEMVPARVSSSKVQAAWKLRLMKGSNNHGSLHREDLSICRVKMTID